jgi:hypothetical protein
VIRQRLDGRVADLGAGAVSSANGIDPTAVGGAVNRTLAKAGMALAAFAVFTCGWLAMRTEDWRQIVGFSVLALVAGAVASAFSRQAR